jgi:hypothetical protein
VRQDRGAANRVDECAHLAALPHRTRRGQGQASFGSQRSHDQLLAAGRFERLAERHVFPTH